VTPVASVLTRAWYAPQPTLLAQLLRPFSWLFGGLAALRRAAYRHRLLPAARLAVPVIVVGNITVGGTGKTPLVIALAEALRAHGRRPAIVSRGYGRDGLGVRAVNVDDDPRDTGDEPLILAASAPTWIGADRVAAARALLAARPETDVIVADDGLQHYALARDVEIVVVDGSRDLGNRMLLPAGPLREPPSRLASVDAVVRLRAQSADGATTGEERGVTSQPTLRSSRSASTANPESASPALRIGARARPAEFSMTHEWQAWRNVADPGVTLDVDALRDSTTVAIAGIANPQRFFDALRARGFVGETRAFPDHHRYVRSDVEFRHARAVLMTEKDAVKCRAFADPRMWMMPIRARVDPALVELVMERIDGSKAARDARLSRDEGAAHSRP
jgi:tetraacyldisaccharide 4'-kinase